MRNARTRFGARLAPWGGWAALAGGAVLCAVGWYGVSGERFAERQIPFLASCSIPGAALIIAGAVLVARGDQGLAAARVEELYGLLVAYEPDRNPYEPDRNPAERAEIPAGTERAATGTEGVPAANGTPSAPESAGADAGPPLTVPGGTLLHRPGCPLVAGRPDARPADGPRNTAEPPAPCPVCEPDTPHPGTGR
ncbi:hypothetical protein A6A06_30630 [Streptomyces sp. CB02923]|uniref:hypothetical protein n=1 Tax=Streptomyces sp. CB02923 TaxID=1718985 RepID=UPI00093CCAEE|nr:hypothetical protein [Streptomyces sp. CB02923]OKH98510.1 hypothetical protein A6A06_30630 [Streptomyces sp. CB02923]